ncbi:MAG: hypothetical protein JW795_05260 [Chitinivibrionales bacterium]|nr:hypothetical protein [Chitinivibrionales bacterium]
MNTKRWNLAKRRQIPIILLLIRMHARFLRTMYLFDIGYCCLAVGYLFTPLGSLAVSLDNLVVLLFAIIGVLLYHIHLLRTSCAGVVFYRSLPVNQNMLLISGGSVLIAPFLMFFPVIVAGIYLTIPAAQLPDVPDQVIERMYHVLIIFVLIKTLPLPTYILFKRHPMLVIALYFLIGGLQMVLSMIKEFFLFWMDDPAPFLAVAFVMSVIIVSIRIINTGRMEND